MNVLNCSQGRYSEAYLRDMISRMSDAECAAIVELNLNNANLYSIPFLYRFVNAKVLNCSGNHLTSLKGLECLTELRELLCENNELEELDALPKLTKLILIGCWNNRLKHLPDCSGLENLSICDFRANASLPDELSEITTHSFNINHPMKRWKHSTMLHSRAYKCRKSVLALLGVIQRRRAIRDYMRLVAKSLWKQKHHEAWK